MGIQNNMTYKRQIIQGGKYMYLYPLSLFIDIFLADITIVFIIQDAGKAYDWIKLLYNLCWFMRDLAEHIQL